MPVTRKVEHRDVPISDLIPYERNPRKNDKAVKKVAASLEQFGLVKNSVVVDENMVLITGHTTLKAMQSLGWTACPAVTQVYGLTEEEKRASPHRRQQARGVGRVGPRPPRRRAGEPG